MQSFILIVIFKTMYLFRIYNLTLLQRYLKNYINKRFNKINPIYKITHSKEPMFVCYNYIIL